MLLRRNDLHLCRVTVKLCYHRQNMLPVTPDEGPVMTILVTSGDSSICCCRAVVQADQK